MGKEIERKFLVRNDGYRQKAMKNDYRQGYLSSSKDCVVRIRTVGTKGFITVKSKPSIGITRSEFEYEIPYQDALDILETLCMKPIIEKTRYRCEHQGHLWEIDEFKGENEGLTIAEIELESENEEFLLPDWVGREVTSDHRYHNSNLVRNPYKNWV